MKPSTKRWTFICFIALAGLAAAMVAADNEGAATNGVVDSKLSTETILFRKGDQRWTRIYRVPENKNRTNLVCLVSETQTAGRWVIDSRTYYIAGAEVFSEYDFDENGVAETVLFRNGDQMAGVLRKGKQITGLMPQAEIDEMKQSEKLAAAAGGALGSISPKGKDGAEKTNEEILKEIREKLEELKKKQAQEKK